MNLQYPIGKYVPQDYSEKLKNDWLSDIEFLPDNIETAIANFNEQQFQTSYRDGGWTVHQLVHHVTDSHILGYIRFKVGYTETWPTIQPYDEKVWVNFSDVKKIPANVSIPLLRSLHSRWHAFLVDFTEHDFQKSVFHPEYNKQMSLWYLLGLYAWHSKHHVAHITKLRERMIW